MSGVNVSRDVYTVPQLSRRTGIGPKRLRRAIEQGELVAYTAGSAWPRVLWSDFLAWLRTTQVAPTARASQRVREVLERERRAG